MYCHFCIIINIIVYHHLLLLLLNKRRFPALKFQVSHCSTLYYVWYFVADVLNVVVIIIIIIITTYIKLKYAALFWLACSFRRRYVHIFQESVDNISGNFWSFAQLSADRFRVPRLYLDIISSAVILT